MEYFKRDKELFIRLDSNFNYVAVKKIQELLNVEDIDRIVIDLGNSKIADSEAVKFLYFLIKDGIQITLINPPKVLDKIINILGLEEEFRQINKVKGQEK